MGMSRLCHASPPTFSSERVRANEGLNHPISKPPDEVRAKAAIGQSLHGLQEVAQQVPHPPSPTSSAVT